MNADVFIDTNILVYAHDAQAGERHHRAAALVADLWKRGESPVVSVQVLQELYVNLVRKKVNPLEARSLTESYFAWRVIEHTKLILRDAMALSERWKISYWDAAILAAAIHANVTKLWSEDFSPGQKYGTVTSVNPLAKV